MKYTGLLMNVVLCLLAASPALGQEGNDTLALWREGVRIRPVLDAECHSIHAYFNTSPESPDGTWVLVFRSTAPDAHEGDVCIVRRDTGETRVLARGVTTEDAHRVACQQWTRNGQEVVYHDLREGRWVIAAVDVSSGKERIVCEGRQLAWGQPSGETVPVYGPHWAPGSYRDLDLLNVRTGEIRVAVRVDDVLAHYAPWVREEFGNEPISIFFPILSPDEQRVFFKLASPRGGGFRSPSGSKREGLFVFDLKEGKFLSMQPTWGHPAWHADSRHILNVRSQRLIRIDGLDGAIEINTSLPPVPGSHPSYSADGRLLVTDLRLERTSDGRELWGVLVGDFETGQSVLLHRFDISGGATSWRRSHPHPAFSPDGRRVYFNVGQGRWTQLYVAECGKQ